MHSKNPYQGSKRGVGLAILIVFISQVSLVCKHSKQKLAFQDQEPTGVSRDGPLELKAKATKVCNVIFALRAYGCLVAIGVLILRIDPLYFNC